MLRPLLLLSSCRYYDIRMWERFEELNFEPEAFLTEGVSLWKELGISERNISLMSDNMLSGWIDREIDTCTGQGIRLVTYKDPLYPKSLLDLHDAPLLLYMWGEHLSVGASGTGMVGTRRCSSYGAKIARMLGEGAARCGQCVVSGGAAGIDGYAHAGCIDAGGASIAVLGTGVDVVYPSQHRELFARIRENGGLYSEYRLGTGGEAWHFPKRNRIIAGLSSRVVIVEAPERSGAMITARQAAEIGREVWAVPGRIDDVRCAGSNRLILDGAIPLIGVEAFFEEVGGQKTLFANMEMENPPDIQLDETERRLLALLTDQGDRTIDNLANEAKMSAAEVLKTMTMLTIKGVVRSSAPGRYSMAD